MAEQVDALILGSGQGSNPLASALAARGQHVIMVEAKQVGGTCVNSGCTPTKTMIASAQTAYRVRRAADYGVHTGPVTVSMAEVRDRKRGVVDKWRSGSEKSLASNDKIELVRGLGRFTGEREIEVALNEGSTRVFKAEKVFLNTGLRTMVPPGFEGVPYLTNETVMELDEVPRRLLILGGSYIAVEFAQMFRRFGAEVAIVGREPHLMPREDADISEALEAILKEEGIELRLGAHASGARAAADAIEVALEGESLSGSHLLLAAGRLPNSDGLNLQAAGLEPDEHGFIPVNERLETVAPGVYALGDVKGGPAFTHISYDDYRILAANLLEGGHRTVNDRPVPYTVFTDPELGRIGVTERDARNSGRKVRVARMPASSIARAYETGEDRGLIKVVVDAETEQILGAAMLAGEGGELAAMVQIAMMGKLPYTALRDGVFAHPTWAESLNTIFSKWEE